MKQVLPQYLRSSDGVEFIAINTRAGTNLGRALSLGAGYNLQTNYHGDFMSLGGLVRYLARHNDPFARVAQGAEQDMEISSTFDDAHTGTFINAMWQAVSGVEWIVKALAENKLPFVYYVNFDDGEGLQPVKMPQWFSEALSKCASNARAGKFVKQAVPEPKPEPVVEVDLDLPPWARETDVKAREASMSPAFASGPVIDEKPKQSFDLSQFEKKAAKKQVVKTPKADPVFDINKGKAEIQLWFKRLQALSVEQKTLVDQILEPFDELICKPVPDEEVRDTHLPLMLRVLENITDKQVADSIARGVWTYVFDASYGTPEVIAKLRSYYVPEEE